MTEAVRHQRWWFLLLLLIVCAVQTPARAHETRPALLEMTAQQAGRFAVLWKVPTRGDRVLALKPVLPAVMTRLGPPIIQSLPGARVERSTYTTNGKSLVGERLAIDGLVAVQTDVLLRVQFASGHTFTALLKPGRPWIDIEGPRPIWQAGWDYVKLGIDHILSGVDHLLFVLGLLLIVRSRVMLLKTITAFTVAHSITLALATLGYVSTPTPPLNAAIALSIFFLGPEIVRMWRGESSLTIRHPWLVAFAFGLLHGFGFASGLNTMGLPSREIVVSLLFFNLGVELGQLCFVLLALALARALRALEFHWPRWVDLVPAYAIGSLGALWTVQRTVMMLQ